MPWDIFFTGLAQAIIAIVVLTIPLSFMSYMIGFRGKNK